MSNIKLAIRLRPFSDREIKSEKINTPVVNVLDDHTVTITNVKVSTSGAGDSRERVRRYHADYTFDSCCDNGSSRYASQDKVFETMGRDVLSCITGGAPACVLAYGQSATGKTHTMMGTDDDPGIIPRLCDALFSIDSHEITVSFLEIYNERVHDLLVDEEQKSEYPSLPRRRGNSRKDLRVREHPAKGPYVQNLRRVVVHDAQTLRALVEEGARRRKTAATRRNASSSRSHALLELSTSQATLHLADLAGSEKASWEGCGSGRQKEGANINKSLVALSNVISALVSSGTGRGRFVPYRDSALTWLLKDCFTGGAAGFIIATVSPSVACYGESASTLRWASRARQLRASPRPRTSSTQVTRAALHHQLQQIISELAKHHIQFVPETGKLLFNENHSIHYQPKVKDVSVVESHSTAKVMNLSKLDTLEMRNSQSTPSSVASGSSDLISNVEKLTTDRISKEVDKLFGPALERTQSGIDLKVVAPLRHKRRQYRSQEVLSLDNKNGQSVQHIRERKSSLQDIDQNIETSRTYGSIPDTTNKTIEEVDVKQPQTRIIYDNNQRAEIVASVTERLYSKLKKKEESALSKVENVVDKKIMEPLSELKICTNARQRLVDLSQKALRNRRKIGIPAYTQTKLRVTRVRDQGIDVQTDLQPHLAAEKNKNKLYQDVSTETSPVTPRCKEICVGPQWGSIRHQNRSTITEKKTITQKSCSVMTEHCVQHDRYTQTKISPPPRKKKSKSPYSKYLSSTENIIRDEITPVISINITQTYSNEQDSTSASDESINNVIQSKQKNMTTPDLLTNHSSIEDKESLREIDTDFKILDSISDVQNYIDPSHSNAMFNLTDCNKIIDLPEEIDHNSDGNKEVIFSDSEDCNLPRVTVTSSTSYNQRDIKNMILGRNDKLYPYNIVLSPPHAKTENTKRTVKFKDLEVTPTFMSVASQTGRENAILSTDSNDQQSDIETDETKSDSTNASKLTNNFVWKAGTPVIEKNKNTVEKSVYKNKKDVYKPIYKYNMNHYKNAKTRLYKEFLGLETDLCSSRSSSDERSQRHRSTSTIYESDEESILNEFKHKREFFENKGHSIFNQTKDPFYDFESKLLKSCDKLDASINKYDDYLISFNDRSKQIFSPRHSTFSHKPAYLKPTEYLHHLVQLRKDVVKQDFDSADNISSGSVF